MVLNKQNFIIITIDGAAASGKSSTSKGVAKRLNLLYVDTGLHYRALTYCLHQLGVFPTQTEKELKEALNSFNYRTAIEGNEAKFLIGQEVLREANLRSEAVNKNVSLYAALPMVRTSLLSYQRSLVNVAKKEGFDGLIIEGRDIGSVVFPHADYKFFLEAEVHTRAQRRFLDGQADTIQTRDTLDSSRKVAPLVCPKYATRVDTSELSLEEVIDFICDTVTS